MSNKTPAKPQDEIESAPKLSILTQLQTIFFKNTRNKYIALGVVFLLTAILLVSYMSLDDRNKITTPKGTIFVTIADTPETRTQGLSGRKSLGDEEGLLFVFDNSSVGNCFWMKDMNFPIDMIWLDENKQVVTVREFIKPETYPESFCPSQPAKYGLELFATKAYDFGIEEGVVLRW